MRLRQIKGQAMLDELAMNAAADDHKLFWPTMAIEKGGELVGYVSVPFTPTIYLWADSKRMTALDSVRALKEVEQIMQQHGWSEIMVPCAKDSPFFSKMQRLGFEEVGEATFFKKPIGQTVKGGK